MYMYMYMYMHMHIDMHMHTCMHPPGRLAHVVPVLGGAELGRHLGTGTPLFW